jgi:hypothetical protein
MVKELQGESGKKVDLLNIDESGLILEIIR